MKIKIHRGIDQIGGCITEISTASTRILIDFGLNLPNGLEVPDKFANKEAVDKITEGISAIFYTHYHSDHIGLFPLVNQNIEQYIGVIAKQVMEIKHRGIFVRFSMLRIKLNHLISFIFM